jgi:putative ABC transport system ATP-binding protein
MLTQTARNALSLTTLNVYKTVQLPDSELAVLKDVSFKVPAGGTCAIVGRSGSGKTTLLGILAGLDTPSSGSVCLGQEELTSMSEDERAGLRGRSIGFVFQSFHLLDHLTALKNVMLPMELKGMPDAKARAQAFLTKMGLKDRTDHLPKQLSGGEQQRVAIARAFACEPQILFADEPTGNLDGVTGSEIVDSLFELNAQQGTTLVLVTHDEALAARCDQQLRLEKGVVTSG